MLSFPLLSSLVCESFMYQTITVFGSKLYNYCSQICEPRRVTPPPDSMALGYDQRLQMLSSHLHENWKFYTALTRGTPRHCLYEKGLLPHHRKAGWSFAHLTSSCSTSLQRGWRQFWHTVVFCSTSVTRVSVYFSRLDQSKQYDIELGVRKLKHGRMEFQRPVPLQGARIPISNVSEKFFACRGVRKLRQKELVPSIWTTILDIFRVTCLHFHHVCFWKCGDSISKNYELS